MRSKSRNDCCATVDECRPELSRLFKAALKIKEDLSCTDRSLSDVDASACSLKAVVENVVREFVNHCVEVMVVALSPGPWV
tara:strand:+ start:274 stop:516 length:243 start_codon:yes stop_codon:yes gene_type:complete